MNTPVVKVKGIPLEIGGNLFIVPPLSIGAIEQLREPLSKLTADVTDFSNVSVIVDATHAALKRNYPDITREEIADGIGLENMADVLEAVMDVSGLKRKAKEAANDGAEK